MRDNILNAISYSRYSGDVETPLLSVSQIICCHQHIRMKAKLSNDIKQKIEVITRRISINKWKKPELRYNNLMALEVYDEDKCVWKRF